MITKEEVHNRFKRTIKNHNITKDALDELYRILTQTLYFLNDIADVEDLKFVVIDFFEQFDSNKFIMLDEIHSIIESSTDTEENDIKILNKCIKRVYNIFIDMMAVLIVNLCYDRDFSTSKNEKFIKDSFIDNEITLLNVLISFCGGYYTPDKKDFVLEHEIDELLVCIKYDVLNSDVVIPKNIETSIDIDKFKKDFEIEFDDNFRTNCKDMLLLFFTNLCISSSKNKSKFFMEYYLINYTHKDLTFEDIIKPIIHSYLD